MWTRVPAVAMPQSAATVLPVPSEPAAASHTPLLVPAPFDMLPLPLPYLSLSLSLSLSPSVCDANDYAAGRGSVAWSTESMQRNASTHTSPSAAQANGGSQRSVAELERLLAAAEQKLAEVPTLQYIVRASRLLTFLYMCLVRSRLVRS